MNKALEELYSIKGVIKLFSPELYDEFFDGLDVIETELKRLEEIEDKYYKTIEGKGIPSPNYDKVKPSKLKKQNEILERTLNKVIGEKNDLAEILRIVKKYTNLNVANKGESNEQKCIVMVVMENNKEFDLLKELLK